MARLQLLLHLGCGGCVLPVQLGYHSLVLVVRLAASGTSLLCLGSSQLILCRLPCLLLLLRRALLFRQVFL